MTKNRFVQILLITLSALIILGVALIIWVLVTAESRNEIKVVLEDGKTEVVEFEDLALVPGDSFEYTIKLKGDNAKKYELTLDYIKTTETEGKTLADFAYVLIIAEDNIVYDSSLANALKDEPLVLPVNFREDLNTELTVKYYLPVNVSSEAENLEAEFALKITASNE